MKLIDFLHFSYSCKYHYRLTSKIQMSLMPTHLGGEHLQMRCALRLIKDHPRLKNHLLYIESNMKILLRIFPVSFPKGFCNHYSIIILYVEKDNHFQKAFKVKIVAQLKFFSEKATYFSVAFSTTYQSSLALFT